MMKFSPSIAATYQLASASAVRLGHAELEPEHIMMALMCMADSNENGLQKLGLNAGMANSVADEVGELRVEFHNEGIDILLCKEQLSQILGKMLIKSSGGNVGRTRACRQMFDRAQSLANVKNELFRAVHLLQAILAQPTAKLTLWLEQSRKLPGDKTVQSTPVDKEEKDDKSSEESPKRKQPVANDESTTLARLTRSLRTLRTSLKSRIFAQDHAIEAFIEGLFNAEITADLDTERRAPRALFVFAGPPGVGKTFLAESGAAALERPFRRFDMSSFSGFYSAEALVGVPDNYPNPKPGLLTGFVDKNPNAILLFDEIEKAHLDTIHYFLQVLDAGILEDKFLSRNVSFRDTTVIFTTNIGRKLYDNPSKSGVHIANASFHRQTIIDALRSELKPITQEPYFPEAICSRISTGYPILFNHLGINELGKVASSEIERTATMLGRQLFKEIELDPLLPLLLVMKEGGSPDARMLRAQSGIFIKNEIFKMAQLFSDDRLEDALNGIDSIRFELDTKGVMLQPEIETLLQPDLKPGILLVGSSSLAELFKKNMPDLDWRFASTPEDALAMIADDPPDLTLIDLWLDADRSKAGLHGTIANFDHAPPAAKELDRGQELLRKMHERVPDIPVVLLLVNSSGKNGADEELLAACIRAGGAREAITCNIENSKSSLALEQFRTDLLFLAARVAREKSAGHLALQRKVVSFDTAPLLDKTNRVLRIRLRNLRLSRAVRAGDAGEILDDVERPQTRFDDVIGADSAKEELRFFIDYLKNPRRFSALGLKAPKGILLYGPPGTGKTMLARAMAGESDVSFLAASASSFVTMWQGSGAENVRALFARARRYAPAIVFIDEIDAIGKERIGNPSAVDEEKALNALLTEMDGFSAQQTDRPVFVLAATNFRIDTDEHGRDWRNLDAALVRRFSRTILVDLPDTAARRRYFVKCLESGKKIKIAEQTLDRLAEKSYGMSIANLEQILETAGRNALRTATPLNDDLLLEALDTVRDGEVKKWTPELLEGTAWHEAGHTVMYWLSGWLSPEVTIVARASYGGGMHRSEEEYKRESRTRNDLLAEIRCCLGGRAAELLHFGEELGLSTGVWGDLDQASKLARQMICTYGMDEAFGLGTMGNMINSPEALGTPLYREIQQRVVSILKEQDLLTRQNLSKHRQQLDAVANALLKKNRLLRSDLEEILGPPVQ